MKNVLIAACLLWASCSTLAQSVIFSDKPFAQGDRATMKEEFTLKDRIYGRLLVPNSLSSDIDLLKVGDNYAVLVNINYVKGKKATSIGKVNLWVSNADAQKNYIDFDILPPAESVNSMYVGLSGNFAEITDMDHPLNAFRNLLPGNPIIEIGCSTKGGTAFYSGKLKIKIEQSDNAEESLRVFFIDKIRPAMASKFASAQGLPALFNKKTTAFKDKELSVENIKKLFKASAKADVVHAVAIDDNDVNDYTVKQNELGVPLYKYTARTIMVAYKLGDKCKYTTVMLQRSHLGGGKYGPLEFSNLVTTPKEVNCNSFK